MHVDAAYFFRPSSMVCRSVCNTSEPCKDGCTDRDAVWVKGSGGPKEPCIRWGPDPPWEGVILRGKGHHIVMYRDTAVICARTGEPIEMPFGLGARIGRRYHVLDGGPAVLRDVAMATNFGTKIAINWLCVNDGI